MLDSLPGDDFRMQGDRDCDRQTTFAIHNTGVSPQTSAVLVDQCLPNSSGNTSSPAVLQAIARRRLSSSGGDIGKRGTMLDPGTGYMSSHCRAVSTFFHVQNAGLNVCIALGEVASLVMATVQNGVPRDGKGSSSCTIMDMCVHCPHGG